MSRHCGRFYFLKNGETRASDVLPQDPSLRIFVLCFSCFGLCYSSPYLRSVLSGTRALFLPRVTLIFTQCQINPQVNRRIYDALELSFFFYRRRVRYFFRYCH